jgi:hypothetical protein
MKWGINMSEKYCSIEFLQLLRNKYSEYLKPEIVEVHLIQNEDEVLLDIVELKMLENGLKKYTTTRINTDFITDFDDTMDEPLLFLEPSDEIEVNVIKFVEELDPYSISVTTDLFHDEACNLIKSLQ